jgi:cystathionine beta-lyase/cystathionine gamma-synthase
MSTRNKDKSAGRATGTNAVHAGEEKASVFGSVATPIIQSSTFFFADNAELEDYLAGRKERHLYSRWSHPTAAVAEAKIAALEGAESALSFSSGMAAISSAVLSFAKTGDRILALESIYGGTYELFTQMCPRYGIDIAWARAEEMPDAAKAADSRTKLVYVESPTNPNLKVVDLRALTEAAHKRGIPIVIDNTFATPVLQKPLQLGCDVVVHSATKYLAGHSDLICGFVAGSKERISQVYEFRKLFGGVLNAGSAGLLVRGMKTVELRVRRQCENAMALAGFLSTHPKVESVNYPGLPSDPYHVLAKSQMSAFTGMLSFTVRGGLQMARKVTDRFDLILYAPSLGGVETLATLPVRTSHLHYSPEDLKRAGVSEGMIRISCGIEAADDLIADLKQALG